MVVVHDRLPVVEGLRRRRRRSAPPGLTSPRRRVWRWRPGRPPRELGFDALGVDPAAPAHPRLIREPAEHARGLGTFDAVTAVMALHHAGLDAMTSALARLLRPDGRLFVYDFDWDAYDDRAAAWLARQDSFDPDNWAPG